MESDLRVVDDVLATLREGFSDLSNQQEFIIYLAGSFSRGDIRYKGELIYSDLECVLFHTIDYNLTEFCSRLIQVNKELEPLKLSLEVDIICVNSSHSSPKLLLHAYEAVKNSCLIHGRLAVDTVDIDSRSINDIIIHRIFAQIVRKTKGIDEFRSGANKDVTDLISVVYYNLGFGSYYHKMKIERLEAIRYLLAEDDYLAFSRALDGALDFNAFRKVVLKTQIRLEYSETLLSQPSLKMGMFRKIYFRFGVFLFKRLLRRYFFCLNAATDFHSFRNLLRKNLRYNYYRIFFNYLAKC